MLNRLQPFRIGDKVIRVKDGVFGQVSHIGDSEFPLYVAWENNEAGTYTADGRLFWDGDEALYLIEPASWSREFRIAMQTLAGFCVGVFYGWLMQGPL